MFEHFQYYPWVLPVVLYQDEHSLLANIEAQVIAPAEAKAMAQTGK